MKRLRSYGGELAEAGVGAGGAEALAEDDNWICNHRLARTLRGYPECIRRKQNHILPLACDELTLVARNHIHLMTSRTFKTTLAKMTNFKIDIISDNVCPFVSLHPVSQTCAYIQI